MTDAGNANAGSHAANAALDAGGAVRLARAQPHRRRLGCRRGVALPCAAAFGRPPSPPTCSAMPARFPLERRKQIWDQTAEERRHIRPFRREVRAAREETIKALVAEPFDRDEVPRRSGAAGRGREPRPGRGAGPLRQDCRQPDAAGAARLPALARASPPARPQSAGRARPPGRRADPAVGERASSQPASKRAAAR